MATTISLQWHLLTSPGQIHPHKTSMLYIVVKLAYRYMVKYII